MNESEAAILVDFPTIQAFTNSSPFLFISNHHLHPSLITNLYTSTHYFYLSLKPSLLKVIPFLIFIHHLPVLK